MVLWEYEITEGVSVRRVAPGSRDIATRESGPNEVQVKGRLAHERFLVGTLGDNRRKQIQRPPRDRLYINHPEHYVRRGRHTKGFLGSTQLPELALICIEPYRDRRRVRERLVEWMVEMCLQ